MFLLNKTKGNTIFYTHLFIKKIMFGHFTFFFNYYFKGTGQIQKLMGKRKKEKKKKELQKKVIKTKERKRKNEMKKKAQNNMNICRLVTEKEKKGRNELWKKVIKKKKKWDKTNPKQHQCAQISNREETKFQLRRICRGVLGNSCQ